MVTSRTDRLRLPPRVDLLFFLQTSQGMPAEPRSALCPHHRLEPVGRGFDEESPMPASVALPLLVMARPRGRRAERRPVEVPASCFLSSSSSSSSFPPIRRCDCSKKIAVAAIRVSTYGTVGGGAGSWSVEAPLRRPGRRPSRRHGMRGLWRRRSKRGSPVQLPADCASSWTVPRNDTPPPTRFL